MNRSEFIDRWVEAQRTVPFYVLSVCQGELLHQQATIPKGTLVWRHGEVVGDRWRVTCAPSRRDRRVRICEIIAWSDGDDFFPAARWEGEAGYLHWCHADAVALTTPAPPRTTAGVPRHSTEP